jgi:hypothetical protein
MEFIQPADRVGGGQVGTMSSRVVRDGELPGRRPDWTATGLTRLRTEQGHAGVGRQTRGRPGRHLAWIQPG